jgi:hypothetical protein
MSNPFTAWIQQYVSNESVVKNNDNYRKLYISYLDEADILEINFESQISYEVDISDMISIQYDYANEKMIGLKLNSFSQKILNKDLIDKNNQHLNKANLISLILNFTKNNQYKKSEILDFVQSIYCSTEIPLNKEPRDFVNKKNIGKGNFKLLKFSTIQKFENVKSSPFP